MLKALRPSRGGFLRPFGCGEFIRGYLMGKGAYGSSGLDPKRGAPIVDILAAYRSALLRAHAEDMAARALEKGIELSVEEASRRVSGRFTKVRSHSFYRYFHLLKQLEWVEVTGEEEDSLPGGVSGAAVELTHRGTTLVEVPQPRRFYRINDKGREASRAAWSDPLMALYAYPRELRSRRHGAI